MLGDESGIEEGWRDWQLLWRASCKACISRLEVSGVRVSGNGVRQMGVPMGGWSRMSCREGSLPCVDAKSRSQVFISARTRAREWDMRR